jgi:TP901 family phage tail tape measure protein
MEMVDRLTKPARKAGKAVFDLSANLTHAAEGVARLAEQAKQLLIKPVVEFAEYEKAIAEVSTLVDEAVISNQDLIDITERAALTFGGKAKEQATALYQAISAGASSAAEATALLDAANRLSIGGVTEVETAIDGLTTVINAYGMGMENAEDASDSFFVAVRAGKTTVGELASGIGKVAPIAAALGLSLDETNAAIAALTKQGINTKFAVSGLKAAFANILKPSKDAADEAKRLGIQFDVAALEAKGLHGFLSDVTRTSGLSAKQLQKISKEAGGNADVFQVLVERAGGSTESMSKLFGSIEGINAVLALTAAGGKEFAAILKQMQDKAGETGTAHDKMAKTQAQAFEKVKAQLDSTTRAFGEQFTPAVSDALTNVVEITRALTNFAKAHPDLVGAMGSLLIKLVAVGAVLRTTMLLTSTLAGAKGMLGLFASVGAAGGAAGDAASKFVKLEKGAWNVTKQLWGAKGGIAASVAIGYAIGTWADETWDLSDALSGVNQELNKFKRGAPAMLEDVPKEQRKQLKDMKTELAKRLEESEKFGKILLPAEKKRIEQLKRGIDTIEKAAREAGKRRKAVEEKQAEREEEAKQEEKKKLEEEAGKRGRRGRWARSRLKEIREKEEREALGIKAGEAQRRDVELATAILGRTMREAKARVDITTKVTDERVIQTVSTGGDVVDVQSVDSGMRGVGT